jgi:pimeloyl-ACP methyl ester carboxylesterase
MNRQIVNGTYVSYQDQGQGLPLMLLHGYPLDGRLWQHQLAGLSDEFRVIAPDLRGFGQSTGGGAFSMESQADDVHALAEALNLGKFFLAGLSMGGYITLAYCRKYPSTLRGVGLIDTRAEADTPEGRKNRDKAIELVGLHGSKAIADQMLPKLLAPETINHRPQLASIVRQMCEQCSPQTIATALAAMRDRADQTEFLPSLAEATLIIVGDQDAITPPVIADAMHKAIPQSQLVVIRGAGHLAPLEQPQQVNRALRAFLKAG